jgi:hypothetical protein
MNFVNNLRLILLINIQQFDEDIFLRYYPLANTQYK